MNGFSFVLCLPEALFAHILVDWLLIRAIARLDSAFCARNFRETFLDSAFRHIQGTYTERARLWNTEGRLRWYVTRGVPMDGMELRGVLLTDNKLREELLTSQGARWQWLKVSTSSRDPHRWLTELARWCPNLREIDIQVDYQLKCDDCFAELAAACQHLEVATLNSAFTTGGLAMTLANCKALRHLHMTCDCSLPKEVAIPTLETLYFEGSVPEVTVLAIGARCPELQTLTIFYNNRFISDAAARAVLQGCPKLRNTDIQYAERVSNEVRVQLFMRDSQSQFDLDFWYGLTSALAQDLLSAWPHLAGLYCSYPRADGAMNDATLAACGAHCPQLQEVYIEDNQQITNQGVLALLQPGNHLQCVCLRDCPQLTEAVVLAIAQNCPNLNYCDLSYMELTDASIVQLAEGCHLLRTVTLDWTDVGDAGVTALAQRCRSLETLNIAHTMSQLTIAGVQALAQHAAPLIELQLPERFARHRDSAGWPQQWASDHVDVRFGSW